MNVKIASSSPPQLKRAELDGNMMIIIGSDDIILMPQLPQVR